MEELDIVSNQHLSMEMFLIRLTHLKDMNKQVLDINDEEVSQKTEKVNYASPSQKKEDDDLFGIKDKAETIGQLKNIAQEKDIKIKDDNQKIELQTKLLNSFDDLLELCSSKKEIKLKYELEKNVNPVSYTHLTLPTTPYV